MHPAIGNQAHQVQCSSRFFRSGGCIHEHRVAEERAVIDGQFDAGERLVDDKSGTEVEVANFGVAHLAVDQANIQTTGP